LTNFLVELQGFTDKSVGDTFPEKFFSCDQQTAINTIVDFPVDAETAGQIGHEGYDLISPVGRDQMVFILDPVEHEPQEFWTVEVGKGFDTVFIPPGSMGHLFQPL
jgi:hypothetical protein